MISYISDPEKAAELLDKLSASHYSRRIKSHFCAYRTAYDFCRIYALYRNETAVCIINIFNSAAVAALIEKQILTDGETEELAGFLRLCSPGFIELPPDISCKINEYTSDMYRTSQRYEFRYAGNAEERIKADPAPSPDDVFEVLKESFPDLRSDYALWLTDVSHRVRRGLIRLYLYEKCASLTVSYMIGGTAMISQVAVRKAFRGRGIAGKLLTSVCDELSNEGFEVRLFSGKELTGFYSGIGFELAGIDTVFEREEK